METILIVLGILVVLVLGFGIYRLATRDQHEANILRVHGKVKREQNFSTVIFAILSIIGLFALLFAFTIL